MTQDISWNEAQQLMRAAEKAFSEADVEAVLEMFTNDITARYAGLPDVSGRGELRELLEARFARQQDYRADKTLWIVHGDRIVDTWTGEWTDRETERDMVGEGMEILRLEDGQVADLRAVFHSWDPAGDDHAQIT